MTEQLYRKIQQGGRVRYVPVEESPEEIVDYDLTNEQAVTIAGALGVTLLSIFERHMPAHKRVAKKINAVKSSILDLFQGTGQKVAPEVSEWIMQCWDKAVCLAGEIPCGKKSA